MWAEENTSVEESWSALVRIVTTQNRIPHARYCGVHGRAALRKTVVGQGRTASSVQRLSISIIFTAGKDNGRVGWPLAEMSHVFVNGLKSGGLQLRNVFSASSAK